MNCYIRIIPGMGAPQGCQIEWPRLAPLAHERDRRGAGYPAAPTYKDCVESTRALPFTLCFFT